MSGFMNWCLGAFVICMALLGIVALFDGDIDRDENCVYRDGYYHCSNHPMTYDVAKRLECVDKHCEVKIGRVTGDKFKFMEIQLENGERPMGYFHLDDWAFPNTPETLDTQ